MWRFPVFDVTTLFVFKYLMVSLGGHFPWRKSEGDPFSFPNRIWKLRHRNWSGRWETGSVGYKGPWPVDAQESAPLAHWFSASSDAPALPRGTRPVHLRPGVEDQVSMCALQAGGCQRVKVSCPSELIPLPREASGRAEQSGVCRSSELGLCWEPGGKDKQASSPNVFSGFLSHFLKGMNVSVFP